MLKFGKAKVAENKFYGSKQQIKTWHVYVDNKVSQN